MRSSPTISRGTGTPVKGGINEREAADIILDLIQNERVCCLEFTEIEPYPRLRECDGGDRL
jgi:arginase